MNHVCTHLLSQQLLWSQFGHPTGVVERMNAMQAQYYAMMRLAVAVRMKNGAHHKAAQMLTEAFDQGQIIRMHTPRMTWQLMPKDLALPILKLCTVRTLRTLRGWTNYFGFDPDDETQQNTNTILNECLCGGKSLPLGTLTDALQKKHTWAPTGSRRATLYTTPKPPVLCATATIRERR